MTLTISTGIAGTTILGTAMAALITGAPTGGTAACITVIIHLSGTIPSGMIRSGDLRGASAGTIRSGALPGASVSVLSGMIPGITDTDMLGGMIRGTTAILIIMEAAAERTSVTATTTANSQPAVRSPISQPTPVLA